MSDFPGFILTKPGQALLAKLQAGGQLTFTRVFTGSGRMPPGNNVFSAVAAGAGVTITNSEVGAAGAADVDTGFTVAIATPGSAGVAQVATVQCLAADQLAGGEYFTLSSPYLLFHVWFTKDGVGSDPAPAGSIGIRVDLAAGNTAIAVAATLATTLDSHRLDLSDLCCLITARQDLAVQSVGRVDDAVSEIRVILTNAGLAVGYDLCEIGIFATDPDVGEILYAVTNAGDQGDYFPAEGGATLIEAELSLRTIIAAAAELSMEIKAGAYAGLAQFVEHTADGAAHQDMRQRGSVKDAVRVATTGEISLSGEQTIDGVAVVFGDAVLVKDQLTTSANGIYVVSTGAWARREDADTAAKLVPRMMVPVKEGTANGGTLWWLETVEAITLEVTALIFEPPFARLAGDESQVFKVAEAITNNDAVPLLQVQALLSDIRDPYGFHKLESGSPAFIKIAAGGISIKAGTKIMVAGVAVNIAINTAVVMPALTAGTDYAIYACTDGTVRADASFTAPAGYTTETSRLIGGFHYGLVAPGTTVAGGSFATTGNGMIWTQADVDLIAGINVFSIWDLKWRAASNDSLLRAQKGFSFVNGLWVANYLCSTDHIANGLSKAGTNIASGTVLPKKPLAFGGNGAVTYANMDWWTANEIVRAYGAKLMRENLFVDAAFGVTENQSIDSTAATYPTTQRNAGYTSKYGLEQASGHHWTWGEDSSFRPDGTVGWAYNDVTGGRGQIYLQNTLGLVRVLLGGHRTSGVDSGSRCSNWLVYPWYSDWAVGVRAACDHLVRA